MVISPLLGEDRYTPLSEGRQGTQPGVGRGLPGVPNRLMMRAWVRPPYAKPGRRLRPPGARGSGPPR